MITEKINIGVIGAGRIGKLHIQNVYHHLPQARIKTVAEPNIDVNWFQRFEINEVVEKHEIILDDPEIDAVLICTPTQSHAELIKACAKAGKHIFCEKPVAMDSSIIRELVAFVEAQKVKLQVGFNRRFDPNFSELKQAIDMGKIGTPHIIRITSRDPEPPSYQYIEQSGGLFLDQTIHDFDMARFLTGSEAKEVFACGDALVDKNIKKYNDIDTAIVTLTFENGTFVVIDNSRKAVYGYDQRVETFGDKGSIEAANEICTKLKLRTAEGITTAKPLYFFLERYKDSFIAEIEAFVNCIINDSKPTVTAYDGLMPVLIAEAAKKSLQEKRAIPVETE